jgi:hypothetical protein
MEKTFAFYSDPSHGWAKVPVKLLVNIGIADKVSSYSYYRNGFAYLEEVRDLHLLLARLKTMDVDVKFKDLHSNRSSAIRNYKSFNTFSYKGGSNAKM